MSSYPPNGEPARAADVDLPDPGTARVMALDEFGNPEWLLDSQGREWMVVHPDGPCAPAWMAELCDPLHADLRAAGTWTPTTSDVGTLEEVADYATLGPCDDFIALRGRWRRNRGGV